MKYYEVVRLGDEETRHYICSICETDRKMFVSEESELRIIRHIQTSHADKNLVVETTNETVKLVPHKPKEDTQKERPAKKLMLFRTPVSNKDESKPQEEIGIDHTFFPCEECPDILLTRKEIRKHMLTHQKNGRPAKKSTLFQTTVINEDGIVFQAEIGTNHIFFPCEECSGIFLTKAGKRKHMLTHD